MPPRSLSLALSPLAFYLSSLPGPLPPVFFSSILGKRRVPLTGTSNQGFLRKQDSRPVKLYSLPFFLPSFFPPCQLVSPSLSPLFSVPFSTGPCRSSPGLSIAGRTVENFDCARVACAKRTARENGSSTAANTIEFRLIGNSIDARVACTLYQTNRQSYRVNRFGIKIVGGRK